MTPPTLEDWIVSESWREVFTGRRGNHGKPRFWASRICFLSLNPQEIASHLPPPSPKALQAANRDCTHACGRSSVKAIASFTGAVFRARKLSLRCARQSCFTGVSIQARSFGYWWRLAEPRDIARENMWLRAGGSGINYIHLYPSFSELGCGCIGEQGWVSWGGVAKLYFK